MFRALLPRPPCALSENPANSPRLRCELSANFPRLRCEFSANSVQMTLADVPRPPPAPSLRTIRDSCELPAFALRIFRELPANDPCGRSAPSSRALPAHYPRTPRTSRVCVANFPQTIHNLPRPPCALSENPANFPQTPRERSSNFP